MSSTFFMDVKELMDPKGMQVKPFLRRDPNGAPIFGPPATYKPGLVIRTDTRIKQNNGDEVTLTVEAYLPPHPPVDKRSLLIYQGEERKIYDVTKYPDPDPSWDLNGFQVVRAL